MQLAQYAATVANDGKRVSPHVVEGIYDNNDQRWPRSVEKAIETKELQSSPYLSGEHGFDQARVYQVANGNEWVDDRKNRWSWGQCAHQCKRLVQLKPLSMGANKPLILMWWRMHHRNNPKIAVAVVFPHNTNLQATVSHSITRDIINLYNQKHPMN